MDWIRNGKYQQWAIGNFILLSLFGLLLRYLQIYPLPGVNYQFILHAHSHFAFTGWMFFSIALLIVHSLSSETYSPAFRQVFRFSLISAFGMLASFSIQGYQPLSIVFSTLFILVSYRFSYLIFKSGKLNKNMNAASRILITGGLIFLCISSLGPFALGPLGAAGFRNTPLYQNAIYFYLHFQMNGFMLLAALGLFASTYLTRSLNKSMRGWLYLFILSAIPVFFIFMLWSKPASWIWLLALFGTLLNLLSWIKLCFYFRKDFPNLPLLVKAAIIAISVKTAFQVVICIPAIGEWTFANRNLIIGYVHLLTLGCIMPLILDQFIKRGFLMAGRYLSIINGLFIFAVSIYLGFLFIQPLLAHFHILIPAYQLLLLMISLLFLVIGILYFSRIKKSGHTERILSSPAILQAS